MNATEKDSLKYGIEYPPGSGSYHYDFEVRLGTVGDNIAAYERPEILGGGVSNMRVDAAVLAACLLSIGTIPKESITPELLETAIDTDFDVLRNAQDRLKKKRMRPSAPSVTGTSDSQVSSSDSTESATSASAS
jgi:hypothetical protein